MTVKKSGQPGADDKSKQTPPGGEGDKGGDKGDGGGEGDGNPGDEGDGGGEGDSSDEDDSKIPEALKPYVQKLRNESAKHRTRAKNLEGELLQTRTKVDELTSGLKKALGIKDESEDPVKKAQDLESHNQALEFEVAVTKAAREYEIPKEHDDYFRFLIEKRSSELEEGAEFGEEDIAAVAEEVKKLAGVKKTSTSVGNPNPPDPTKGNGTMTVETFNKMTTSEKSHLFATNRPEYDRLYALSRGRK